MTEKPQVPAKSRKRAKRSSATRAKGGRPEHQPTIQTRTSVEQMKFCGESHAVIARSLQIDPDTLAKHYAYELESGHATRRKEVIGYLFEQAADGNVSAIKKLEEMGRIAGAAEAMKERGMPQQSATKPQKLGKKEEQQRAAQSVSGIYAVPAAPKLIVNNS